MDNLGFKKEGNNCKDLKYSSLVKPVNGWDVEWFISNTEASPDYR